MPLKLLTGISEVNKVLLNLNDQDDALKQIVKELGKATNVDRCYIFKNKFEGNTIKLFYTHEWCNDGITPELENALLSNHDYDMFPGLYETLSQDKPLFGLVRENTNPFFVDLLTSQGILAYAFTPIFQDDVFWGWMGFDDCSLEREWRQEEIDALHAVSRNLGVRFSRDQAQQLFYKSVERFELTLAASQQGIWEWNVQSEACYFSPRFMEMLGYEEYGFPHEFNEWRIRVHSDEIDIIEKRLRDYVDGKSTSYGVEFRIRRKNGTYLWVRSTGVLKRDINGVPIKMVGSLLEIEESKLKQQELELQRNEYNRLINSLGEAVFKMDENGNILFMSQYWFEITSIPVTEMHDSRFTSYLHQEDVPTFLAILDDLKVKKVTHTHGEFRVRHSVRGFCWAKIFLRVNYGDDGTVFLAGSMIDITERRIAEMELDNVLSSIQDVIYTIDLENKKMRILTGNAEKLDGILVQSNLDVDFFLNRFVHPDDLEISNLSIKDFNAKSQLKRVYRCYNSVQARYIWVSDSVTIIRNKKNLATHLYGVLADIDDFVNSKLDYERELTISNDKYRFLAENSSDLVCQLDPDLSFSYVSSSSFELLGYHAAELATLNPLDLIHPEDLPAVQELVKKAPHDNVFQPLTFRVTTKDGRFLWFETLIKVLYNEHDELIHIQTSSRDISERMQARIEIENALEREKELGELKSNFVSMASHQFRTPLTVIYSNMELLEMQLNLPNVNLEQKVNRVSNRVKAEIERMLELMNNILLFGKYEAHKISVNLLPIDLEKFMDRIVSTYIVHGEDRQLEYELEGSSGGRLFEIDELLFTHVMTNLLSNAFKYSRDSAVNPKVKISFDNKYGFISVIDHGIGIPEAEQSQLFDSFYRASNTTTLEGTGLGMVIVKQFVELHKGKLVVESKLDAGTTITIQLPFHV